MKSKYLDSLKSEKLPNRGKFKEISLLAGSLLAASCVVHEKAATTTIPVTETKADRYIVKPTDSSGEGRIIEHPKLKPGDEINHLSLSVVVDPNKTEAYKSSDNSVVDAGDQKYKITSPYVVNSEQSPELHFIDREGTDCYVYYSPDQQQMTDANNDSITPSIFETYQSKVKISKVTNQGLNVTMLTSNQHVMPEVIGTVAPLSK